MKSNDFLRRNESVLVVAARLVDAFTVSAVGWIVYVLQFQTLELPAYYNVALLLAGAFTLIAFPLFGHYQSWRGRQAIEHLRAIISSVAGVMAMLVIVSALMKTTAWFSRVWFGVWTLSTIAVLFALKRILIMVLRELRRKGWNQRNVLVFGAGELGQMVAQRFHEAHWAGFHISAFADDQPATKELDINGRKIPVFGGDIDLENYISTHQIQELWIALPMRAEERVREILFAIRHSTVQIRFVPNIFSFKLLLGHSVSEVAGIPVVDINVSPITGLNRIVKGLEDRILGAMILVLVSPIMLLIAIAIRLESRGPILFKQLRHGWDGRVIRIYKFRSMFVHNEGGHVTQATKNDPRITKVGRFIRRTSLDELPQFFNVLQGRMSIVGPRPHAISHNEYYKDKVEFYFQRHKVKPGITGWAQINGYRGETDTLEKMEKRIALDLQYIQNWSIWLDLKIIWLTIFKGFVNDKAY